MREGPQEYSFRMPDGSTRHEFADGPAECHQIKRGIGAVAFAPTDPSAGVRRRLEQRAAGRMKGKRTQRPPGSEGGLFDVQDTTGDLLGGL